MRPFIFVLAGVDGAGKSSVGGALLAEHGLTWFNPDGYARELVAQSGLARDQANGRAWAYGRSRFAAALRDGTNYAFEITLGGTTMVDMLVEATRSHRVVVLFCGLSSVELHLARVKLRVVHGGHDIPKAKIRERWVASRTNLIRLLPLVAHLQVFDNSAEAVAGKGIPAPRWVLEMAEGRMVYPRGDDCAACLRHQRGPVTSS